MLSAMTFLHVQMKMRWPQGSDTDRACVECRGMRTYQGLVKLLGRAWLAGAWLQMLLSALLMLLTASYSQGTSAMTSPARSPIPPCCHQAKSGQTVTVVCCSLKAPMHSAQSVEHSWTCITATYCNTSFHPHAAGIEQTSEMRCNANIQHVCTLEVKSDLIWCDCSAINLKSLLGMSTS